MKLSLIFFLTCKTTCILCTKINEDDPYAYFQETAEVSRGDKSLLRKNGEVKREAVTASSRDERVLQENGIEPQFFSLDNFTDGLDFKITTASPTVSPSSISPTIKAPPPNDPEEEVSFSYNTMSQKGPLFWSKLEHTKYFDPYIDTSQNSCDADEQSPINIENDHSCRDDHPPNISIGAVTFSELKFYILPTGFRVMFPQDVPPPKADWSNLSNALRLIHVDVKIRSEHHLFGKSYAGEFQMYFHFPKRENSDDVDDNIVVMSILMDDSDDVENIQLEQFIRQWEEASAKRQNFCHRLKNPLIPQYAPKYYNVYTKQEMRDIWGLQGNEVSGRGSNETSRADFNIWRFMPTGYYCGYKGSLTTPPCTQKLIWRVLDLPMTISKSQLSRLQTLLTNRLDKNCQLNTAASNEGYVNRPLQYNKRGAFCCKNHNWAFRQKDPLYWLEQWPMDYHGWQGTTVDLFMKYHESFMDKMEGH